MKKPSAPATGPLWIDATAHSAIGAIVAIETALLKGGAGARRVVVRVEGTDSLDAVRDWAEDLEFPFSLVPVARDRVELHLYALPAEFGGHAMDASERRRDVRCSTRVPAGRTPPSLPSR